MPVIRAVSALLKCDTSTYERLAYHATERILAVQALASLRLNVKCAVVLPTHVQHDLHHHDGNQGDAGDSDVEVEEE